MASRRFNRLVRRMMKRYNVSKQTAVILAKQHERAMLNRLPAW